MDKPILYDLHTLKEFCINMFIKSGVNQNDAEIISDTLMFAELRNVQSHGIVRLPTYIERMENGVVNKNALMKFINNNAAAVSILDADNGLGQIAGYRAMNQVLQIARIYGIGMVAVKNSNHFGVASYYSMMAINENMIGIAMTNASPAIAPFGSKTPFWEPIL